MALPAPTIDVGARYGALPQRARLERDLTRDARRIVGGAPPQLGSTPRRGGQSLLALRAGGATTSRRRTRRGLV